MRVLLIDDDPIVCVSLQMILETDPTVQVVGIGHDGNEALTLFATYHPDILLMDIRMQPMSGIEAGERIMHDYPTANILYLTTFSDNDYIIKALALGAKGYLLKQDFDSILPALHTILAGQHVFGNAIVTKLPTLLTQTHTKPSPPTPLSEKESELLTLIAKGLSNKEIAETIHLSEGTIRNYISQLLEKLALRDRTQLAIYYYEYFSH